MNLLAIHLVILFLFVITTAYSGVFLIPVVSFMGIPLALFADDHSITFKLTTALVAVISISAFWFGFIQRNNRQGVLINVLGLYLWAGAGFLLMTLKF